MSETDSVNPEVQRLQGAVDELQGQNETLKRQMEKLGITVAAMLVACGVGDDDAMMVPAAVMAEVHGRGKVAIRVGKGENEGDLLISASYDSPLILGHRLVRPS